MDKFCHVCGNKGKEGGCPSCGRKSSGYGIDKIDLDVPANIIPLQYQGKLWTPTSADAESVIPIEMKMQKLLDEFQKGRLLKFSTYIGRPAKSGKHLFAYSCLQSAIMAGYTVAPYLSTSDWRRLYRSSQMNPMYKLYGEYRWDTLVSSDVVFLFVDHSDDRYTVISLLKDLLDTRAGFNLSTVIISDFELASLVPAWNSEEYSLIYNPDPGRDMLRYPAILQSF